MPLYICIFEFYTETERERLSVGKNMGTRNPFHLMLLDILLHRENALTQRRERRRILAKFCCREASVYRTFFLPTSSLPQRSRTYVVMKQWFRNYGNPRPRVTVILIYEARSVPRGRKSIGIRSYSKTHFAQQAYSARFTTSSRGSGVIVGSISLESTSTPSRGSQSLAASGFPSLLTSPTPPFSPFSASRFPPRAAESSVSTRDSRTKTFLRDCPTIRPLNFPIQLNSIVIKFR